MQHQIKVTLFLVLLHVIIMYPQSSLDDYIQEGIAANLALQQRNVPIQQAELGLKTARSYFLPSITLLADYTSGEGGRSIAIPVGDMLNPVYSTLNALTGSNNFPQISNVNQDFFPYQFYDTKLRVSMPIVNTDLIENVGIQASVKRIKEADYEKYKLDLIKEIKTAYYNYLSALAVKEVLLKGKSTALEAKRVNEVNLANGAGLPIYVVRSNSEIAELASKIADSEVAILASKQYFNFLLNKPLTADIKVFAVSEFASSNLPEQGTNHERLEIAQLKESVAIYEKNRDMYEQRWIPKINAFLDLGAQDRISSWNKSSQYYLFGFMMELPLFEGFRNSYKIEDAELNVRAQSLQLREVQQKLSLAANIAQQKVESARASYLASVEQLKLATAYLSLTEKGFREGSISFLEALDARNNYLQAGRMEQVSLYRLLIAIAEYEREIK